VVLLWGEGSALGSGSAVVLVWGEGSATLPKRYRGPVASMPRLPPRRERRWLAWTL
jgi:hypothetical protein